MPYLCLWRFIVEWLFILIISFLIWRVNFIAKRFQDRADIQYRRRKHHTYGYIYFYRGKGESYLNVKIGRTNNLLSRLKSARTSSSPKGLYIIGVMMVKDDVQAEHFIHQKFAHLRHTKRNEWFKMRLPLYLYIRRVRDGKMTQKIKQSIEF